MQKEHRDSIQKNFSTLVERTDLDVMVAALYEKGVFSESMIEPYKDPSKDVRMRKRLLYLDIMRRGPEAYSKLLDALSENGYWDVVRELDPNSSLHAMDTRISQNYSHSIHEDYLSLSEKKKNINKFVKENDPNQRNGQGSSHSNSILEPTTSGLQNGNPPVPQVEGRASEADQMPSIPQFNVIKSKKFFEEDGDVKLYRTRGRCRGMLVVFSYIEYQANIEESRRGAEVDAVNLRYLFTELGFRVLSYSNLPLQETHETLRCLKSVVRSARPETMFIVFSSHGYQRAGTGDNDIRCADGGLIGYYDIIDYFSNSKFPELSDIPKVFIFQTCRGTKSEGPVEPPEPLPPPTSGARRDSGRIATDGAAKADYDNRNRNYSDILIAHSTVPGYVSYRDKLLGSWYIQALCHVFARRAHDTHVDDLFRLVDERLAREYFAQTSSVDRWGFNKLLYLHPGVYEQ